MSDIQLERNRDILKLKKQGLTFKEIAKKYGVSITRIQQICERERNREREDYPEFPELYQAVNELNAQPIMYSRIITRLLWTGNLHNNKWRHMTEEEILEIRNFGPKSVEILKRAQEIAKSK
jgi:transcriptional regulator with XRE-family HTH domain